jgi:hypothetical protein
MKSSIKVSSAEKSITAPDKRGVLFERIPNIKAAIPATTLSNSQVEAIPEEVPVAKVSAVVVQMLHAPAQKVPGIVATNPITPVIIGTSEVPFPVSCNKDIFLIVWLIDI